MSQANANRGDLEVHARPSLSLPLGLTPAEVLCKASPAAGVYPKRNLAHLHDSTDFEIEWPQDPDPDGTIVICDMTMAG
jgi:hypothetical protein